MKTSALILVSVLAWALISVLAASPAHKAAPVPVPPKPKGPVEVPNPMEDPKKKVSATFIKTEEHERKVLLGLVCFMEFGINNLLITAINGGDKNRDAKLTIEEFYNFYFKSVQLSSIVSHSKEELFKLFDRNRDGLLSPTDVVTSSACDQAKEEKAYVQPSFMLESFHDNLDAAMYIKNPAEFDTVMLPIRKYINFIYNRGGANRINPDAINSAVWGACNNIQKGGYIKCDVLQLEAPEQITIIRQWIILMMKWSETHPMN